MKKPELLKVCRVGPGFDVAARLTQLEEWNMEYTRRDDELRQRQANLQVARKIDRQIGASIARQRRRLRIMLSQHPLELAIDEMNVEQLLGLRESLFMQFSGLSREKRLLWLNNFEFILTPDLRRLYRKIEKIRECQSLGQQRGLLIGGPSGMGKTTAINALLLNNEPEIQDVVTITPIVKIDAPPNNRAPRSLFRRIINGLGISYLDGDGEDVLLETAIAFLDACQTELLFVDEVEHIIKHEYKRKLVDLSNQTHHLVIIFVSCNPERWTDGDAEIRGRWNDVVYLNAYDAKNLTSLLAYIEIFLPFSSPSHLDELFVILPDNKKGDGAAKFIYDVTKGILRDVMILIRDACRYAIQKDLPNVDLHVLQVVWRDIQENPNSQKFCNDKF